MKARSKPIKRSTAYMPAGKRDRVTLFICSAEMVVSETSPIMDKTNSPVSTAIILKTCNFSAKT
jgi:hypothetical protein